MSPEPTSTGDVGARCYVTTIDGEAVRVQGWKPETAEDIAAMEALIRAAKRKLAAMPPGPLSVTCPQCGQPVGHFCRNDSDRVTAVHQARREALEVFGG